MNDVLLDYRENLGWHIITKTLYMRMTDTTFQRYVEAYLQQQGIMEPTIDQKVAARQHCRQVSFWLGCHDPEVHRRLFRRDHE